MKSLGTLAITVLAIGLLSSGVGVHALVGSNDSIHALGGDVTVAAAPGGFPRPDYDSGWVPVSPGGMVHLKHSLGGKPDDYVIDMQSRYTLGLSITNESSGADTYYVGGVKTKGYYYTNLTSQEISVVRGKDDVSAKLIRVRIWVCGPVAGCAADFAQHKPFGEGLSPSTITAGQILYLTFGGANEGTEAIAPGWRIKYFASRDTYIDKTPFEGDFLLYETTANFGIAPGEQLIFSEAFRIPTTLPPGEYYIGWAFDPDNEVCESNDDNNQGYIASTKLTVLGP